LEPALVDKQDQECLAVLNTTQLKIGLGRKLMYKLAVSRLEGYPRPRESGRQLKNINLEKKGHKRVETSHTLDLPPQVVKDRVVCQQDLKLLLLSNKKVLERLSLSKFVRSTNFLKD
jgi:hypothetical protein